MFNILIKNIIVIKLSFNNNRNSYIYNRKANIVKYN